MTANATRIAWWSALVLIVAVAVPVFARATGIEAGPLALLVAFMPWVTLACLLPLLLALLARSWALVGVAGLLAAVCVAWQVPLFTGGGEGEPSLTVATVNLRFGEADADAVVALVREYEVDVLAVSELTPEAQSALREAGLMAELPHNVSRPEEGFSGTGLWARYAITGESTLPGFLSQNLSATVDLPGGPVTVFSVHPRAPRGVDHHVWEAELEALRTALARASGPVIVAGDFNTARDHEGFRAIEALGYADADDQAGTGFAATFPVGRGLFPPIVIDHVLERATGLVALRTQTVVIAKADHKALIVEYGARQ